MATTDTTIGPHGIAMQLRAGKDSGTIEEFSAAYQAGFEAGFATGRETGLKEARETGVAQPSAAEKTKTPSRPRRRRKSARLMLVSAFAQHRATSDHFLLGLPCRACGAYYGSDEERCPVCKAQK